MVNNKKSPVDSYQKLEKLAQEKTEELQIILDSIPAGVFYKDKENRFVKVNEAFCNIMERTKKELEGKSIYDIYPKEQADAFWKDDLEIIKSGRPKRNIIEQMKSHKGNLWVKTDKIPYKKGNSIVGIIGFIVDITKEHEIDKAKTEFVSLASHQLRTPLTTVSWYTEMILKGDVGNVVPSQKKYLYEIYQGNQRMIELVNTLLDVSRIELGTFLVKPEPTDIIALAQSVIEEQKLKIKNKKLILIENFDKNVPIFSTDPKLLRMIFQNLLANSVGYTPDGGKIIFEISLSDTKSQTSNILIKVSDTGYGIPKNQQNQIFSKLFRADNVREKDIDGIGLGLYIVKSIVEKLGGKIWFESEQNKGTIFYVTFPFNT